MDLNAEEQNDSNLRSIDIRFPLLQFEKEIFVDVFEKDALLILAKGITYNKIVTNLLWIYKGPSNLVFVLNSSNHEEKYFTEKFSLTTLPSLGADRAKAYLEGGVYFVSTRILVVDLLKNRVPIEHVTGIIVLRAHTVLESCQEAFALRLYRQKNKTGFIKAFSNSPISFTFGYHQVEKVMRSLFVTELFLWPRFHGSIIKNLKHRQARVEEFYIPLTMNMENLQTCLIDIMNYTVKQLKSINRNIDMQEITTENCVTKKFHKILQSQLDCVWHRLSTRTKEYIQDLRILRSMIIKLIHDDSVSFYALISKYRTPEYAQVNSGWILLDSAEQLFKLARARVFNQNNEFDPEPSPKWKYLSELLLEEIPKEVKNKNNGSLSNTKILILCQDNCTCSQLNHYLTMGPNKYLCYTAFRREITISKVSSKYSGLKHIVPTEGLTKDTDKKTKDNKDNDSNQKSSDNEEDDEFNMNESDKSNYVLTLTQMATQTDSVKDSNESMFEPLSQLDKLDATQIEVEKPIIYIQTFKENGNHFSLERTLETVRPEYVILYHADVSAIRQIELFECRKKDEEGPTKVYFMIHDKTIEEQSYLTSLKREKQAFELLIQTKAVMVVPSYQDGKTDEYFNLNIEPEVDVDTRKAGGQTNKEKPVVIVDMREFRSDLPALLHKKGINIEPVTIAIGDYILTPEICVERKSISDLIGSLNSGRLYTQCTQMCRNYNRPILLIEFDQNKPFNLQGHFMVSTDISDSDIRQKLQLLTIHFPRLKLVWSPSPYATAELFYELKQGRKNPNIAEALALSGENVAEDMNYERYNVLIHDFIQKLPGVTSKNISRIMNKGVSLDNLITLSKEELTKIVENKTEAETLFTILHMKPKQAEPSRNDNKAFEKKRAQFKFKNKK